MTQNGLKWREMWKKFLLWPFWPLRASVINASGLLIVQNLFSWQKTACIKKSTLQLYCNFWKFHSKLYIRLHYQLATVAFMLVHTSFFLFFLKAKFMYVKMSIIIFNVNVKNNTHMMRWPKLEPIPYSAKCRQQQQEAIYLHPLPPSQQQRGARYLFSHYRQEAANDAQRPSRKFIARAEKSTGRNDEKGRQDFDFSQFCKLEFSL